MAWTTGTLTQNGNSTFTWNVSGPSQGIHDIIAVGRVSGTSGIKINQIVANGTVYAVTVQVADPGAVGYIIRGGPVP